jgi:hypothetical protein
MPRCNKAATALRATGSVVRRQTFSDFEDQEPPATTLTRRPTCIARQPSSLLLDSGNVLAAMTASLYRIPPTTPNSLTPISIHARGVESSSGKRPRLVPSRN